jgi:hypothetical protein
MGTTTDNMEFIINHTYAEIRRVDENSHKRKFDDVMEDMVGKYEYWSVYDDASLFIYETSDDTEFAGVVDLITKYDYRISKNDRALFLFDDEHETFEQYNEWLKSQDDDVVISVSDWTGWDEPGATCDV